VASLTRLLALHRAEIAGRECARLNGTVRMCPYKSGRGGAGQMREAWVRGFRHSEPVTVYRFADGELSAVPSTRGDAGDLHPGTWKALAYRLNGEIVVEVVYGDRDARDATGCWKLEELVRGDMQD
jgi:hypothetical protein